MDVLGDEEANEAPSDVRIASVRSAEREHPNYTLSSHGTHNAMQETEGAGAVVNAGEADLAPTMYESFSTSLLAPVYMLCSGAHPILLVRPPNYVIFMPIIPTPFYYGLQLNYIAEYNRILMDTLFGILGVVPAATLSSPHILTAVVRYNDGQWVSPRIARFVPLPSSYVSYGTFRAAVLDGVPEASPTLGVDGSWICGRCGNAKLVFHGTVMGGTGYLGGYWICRRCANANLAFRGTMMDGHWVCPRCWNANLAFRAKCNGQTCGAPNPQGPPRAGSWICEDCGRWNYPRRKQCYNRACRAHRPRNAAASGV